MNGRFYEDFRRYSTIELIKIVRESEDYQPEAVAAAQQLLLERNITSEEMEEALRNLQKAADEKGQGMQKIANIKDQIADVVSPVLVPETPLTPSRWFRVFLIFYGVLYAWSFYGFVKQQVYFLRCEDCKGDISLLGSFVNILFLSVVFFLLLMKKRWSWILLVAGDISAILTGVFGLYTMYKYRNVIRFEIGMIVYTAVIPVGLLLFLWRSSIAEFFGVDEKTKKWTALAGVVLGVLYIAMISQI